MPFRWVTQLFSTIFDFIVPPESDDGDIDFLLRGRGNIRVEWIELRKYRSPLEHEYLVVTVKESSGARRRGYLSVDRLDDAQASSDIADAQGAHSTLPDHRRFRKWDPPDALNRLVILRNIGEALHVQDQCTYDIVMSMDLRQAPRHATLEDFLVLIQTTSTNTPLNLTPYTICTVLALETGAPVKQTSPQGKHTWPGKNESTTPEKVKSLWEDAKVIVGQGFDVATQVLRAPIIELEEALRQERAALQQDLLNLQRERAGRLRAEAELNEFRARLVRLEQG
ncbi:hypothetical protein EDD85DRAFT_957151 [Armillaria nabsnona]|nr:hypothetical protein EDD85DRAFT_957151 [Armillaria nabsnona]